MKRSSFSLLKPCAKRIFRRFFIPLWGITTNTAATHKPVRDLLRPFSSNFDLSGSYRNLFVGGDVLDAPKVMELILLAATCKRLYYRGLAHYRLHFAYSGASRTSPPTSLCSPAKPQFVALCPRLLCNSLAAFLFACARHKEKSEQKRNAVYGALPQTPLAFEKARPKPYQSGWR